MIWALLTIIITSSFFILFRYFSIFHINSFQAIVFNYATCVVTGLIFTGKSSLNTDLFSEPWIPLALLIGFLFLLTFNLMSLTVAKISVTAASVANKTSLVIPVAFSILFIQTQAKPFSVLNYIGIGLAIAGIVLSCLNKKEPGNENFGGAKLLLPFLVFLLGGIIDTLINVVNLRFLNGESQEVFPVITFFAATSAGFLLVGYRSIKYKESLSYKALIAGVVLGVPNYFSILVLLKALSAYNNDGAFVFPLVNTGIIVVSTLLSVLLFKEKISMAKGTGIILAILAIIFIYL